ncbi:MAG: glycosyltransferase family 2 protein [Methylococcales bacterium]
MKKTVTLHFYNEEYLLPWWLNYHKKHFDHGILINYNSTDRSVEICKELAPEWQVVNSRNADFGVESLDKELTDIESGIDGWRMSLSVSEFLVGNYNNLDDIPSKQLIVPTITFMDFNPTGSLDKSKELWEQLHEGVTPSRDLNFRRARSCHNYAVKYPFGGRHYDTGTANVNDLAVFHFGNCISSPEMLARRLQIQHRIPQHDKERKWGHNHYSLNNRDSELTEQSLNEYHRGCLAKIDDITETINKYTTKE